MKVRDTHEGTVPYICQANVVVFKIWSCGIRPILENKETDRDHAKKLLQTFDGPLDLSSEQKTAVEEGLPDLLRLEKLTEETWWRKSLGLSE